MSNKLTSLTGFGSGDPKPEKKDYSKHVSAWKKTGKALPNPVPKKHWGEITAHQKKENESKGLTHWGGKKISYDSSKSKALHKKMGKTITLKSGEVIEAGKKYREPRKTKLRSWGDETPRMK